MRPHWRSLPSAWQAFVSIPLRWGKGEEMMLIVSYLVIEHGNEEISYIALEYLYHMSVVFMSMLCLLHLYGFVFLILCFCFTYAALYFYFVYHNVRLCHILLHYIVYIISKHTVSENHRTRSPSMNVIAVIWRPSKKTNIQISGKQDDFDWKKCGMLASSTSSEYVHLILYIYMYLYVCVCIYIYT